MLAHLVRLGSPSQLGPVVLIAARLQRRDPLGEVPLAQGELPVGQFPHMGKMPSRGKEIDPGEEPINLRLLLGYNGSLANQVTEGRRMS